MLTYLLSAFLILTTVPALNSPHATYSMWSQHQDLRKQTPSLPVTIKTSSGFCLLKREFMRSPFFHCTADMLQILHFESLVETKSPAVWALQITEAYIGKDTLTCTDATHSVGNSKYDVEKHTHKKIIYKQYQPITNDHFIWEGIQFFCDVTLYENKQK
jgi:hypothetical protein